MEKIRCQRIGCEATFSDDDNPDGSCRYHPSAPLFHDGMKEWSCCKKRSHDFSLFLAIPGCMTGKHTTEKPVLVKAAPKKPVVAKTPSSLNNDCPRCSQGFFCSDHAPVSQVQKAPKVTVEASASESIPDLKEPKLPKPKKIVGLNEPQTCQNKGCGQTFKEKDNHDVACNYHPGPAVFHDRLKGWKCCDVHVKEFDEFMSIEPCSKGWHNADPES